jgi:hypothetical protein
MGAIAGGRIGTAVVFVLVPAMALLAGRMLTQPARRARRAAWATGLTIALAAAFVPLVSVVALVAALALVAARPGAWRNLAIVAAVPPVLLMPWTLQVAAHPSMLLLEAGLHQPGLADHKLAARSLMLLSPGGPGLPPVWVTAGIALAALVALLLSRRRVLMMVGWGIALSGLVIAIAVSRAVITPGDGGAAVPAWPGVALLIAAVGLLLAGVTAGEALPRLATGGARPARAGQARGGRPGPAGRRGPRPMRGIAAVIVAGAALSAPALAAASWVVSGVRGPVEPAPGPIVPAVVTASSGNGLELRALVLRSDGGQVSYSLQRGASPSLGDADLAPVPSAQQALNTAVAALIAPNGGEAFEQGQLLAQFDIGFVLLPAPVDQGLVRALDGVGDLRPLSATPAFYLWRVTDLSARVRVVEPDGTVVSVPSGPTGVAGAQAPAAGGTIELAEPAGGWNATLSGKPLTPVPSPAGSWAAAYRLPAGGGVLDIGRDQTGRDLILVLQLLVLAALAVLALPGSRAAADEGPAAFGARAAAGLRTPAGSRAAGGGTRAAAGSRVPAGARVPAGSADAEGYPVPAGPPLREAPDTGADGPPGGRRARGRPGRVGQAGRASRGQRRDRNSAPRPRRGRAAAAEPGPDELGPQEFDPEELGAGPVGRRPPAGTFPSGPHAAWPSGQPGDGPSGPHAAWPSGPHAAPASGHPQRRPRGPGSGWPSDEPAAPVAPSRSPSGSWPPPDEIPSWSSGQQAAWPPPQQPSDWPGGRSDVLDPLPPASGGPRGRRAPDDDEARDPRWPVPEHDSGGDAW